MMTAPLIQKWPEALVLMGQNAPRSIELSAELMDEIWYLAGDKSVDLNWYSKRLMLSGVYCSTGILLINGRIVYD